MDDFIHDLPGVDTVKGIYYDAKKEWKQLKRAVLQQLSGNETFRQTAAWKDEIMAHLRWSTRILQVGTLSCNAVYTLCLFLCKTEHQQSATGYVMGGCSSHSHL
jgi:hypothetical protein